jgi:anti-anti-sigma factor
MPIHTQDYEKVCVLIPPGDLVGEESQQLRSAVTEGIDQRQIIDFVVDLQHAQFVDSHGLESLLWIKRRTDDLFGQVKLINVDPNVRKILEITRLGPRFETHHDLATALKLMR